MSNVEHDEFVCLFDRMNAKKNESNNFQKSNKTNTKPNIILLDCIRHFLLVLRNVQCSQFTITDGERIGVKNQFIWLFTIHYSAFGTLYHFCEKIFVSPTLNSCWHQMRNENVYRKWLVLLSWPFGHVFN